MDKNFDKTVNEVRKKGYKFNEKIIDIFFPKYKNRNINILDIQLDFTNVFINIVKLLKLIELNPNNEITIVSHKMNYNYKTSKHYICKCILLDSRPCKV